ncbi:MAG: AmmeMemoRadiSam system protein B [Planctomycetes bacterium]|nr:AmmeMemoRadiSam system protein B [Planctomycetota bacterium]
MRIRYPAHAGTFYESSPSSCRFQAQRLIDQALPADDFDQLYGGIVPHAGWIYSGKLAAAVFKALAQDAMKTVVLLGADHTGSAGIGEVFDSGVWRTPIGEAQVDADLARELIASAGDMLRSNPEAHTDEHSLEVQVPLIQVLVPSAKIVPILVPPIALSVDIGAAIGKVLAGRQGVKVVASSDMTHHGGARFPAPGGRGEAGEKWSRENDRRLIELVEGMNDASIVPETRAHQNACGAGAIAAAIAATRQMGASRGVLLEYTNSFEIVHGIYPGEADDTTVGYAAILFA